MISIKYTDGLRASFFFKNHLQGAASFCKCFINRIVGDGRNINCWEENWGEEIVKNPFPILYTFAKYKEVSLQFVLYSTDLSVLFRPIISQQARIEMNSFIEVVAQTRRVILNGKRAGSLQ